MRNNAFTDFRGREAFWIRRQLGIISLLHLITNSKDFRNRAGKVDEGAGRSQRGVARTVVEVERGCPPYRHPNSDIFTAQIK